MALLRLYTGTSRSRRASHIDGMMHAQWSKALLITPTRSAANRRLERLILDGNRNGVWGRPVLAFEDFASLLLKAEGTPIHPVEEFERRLLVESVVRRLAAQGRLEALGTAATSSGFVSHALRVITQLKQAAVEPQAFRKATAARAQKSWLDDIVADVYEAYQKALTDAGSYDRVGIYWQAEVVARERRPRALDGIRMLILDGFDDFTPSEFRLLHTLAVHVKELVFGIAANVRKGSQQDLYAIPLKTAQIIRETYTVAEDLEFPEPEPAMFAEYLARQIFWRDEPPPPAGLVNNVTVMACPDMRQEVECVGRRIKTLVLDDGVPADRIAVVFRDLTDVAPVARRVFQEFGIPAQFETRPPLEISSLAAFVLTLFEAWETWARDPVLDVITAPWFFPADGASAEHLDLFRLLARHAGIIEGYDEWETRIARLQTRLEHGTGEDVERLLRRAPKAGAAAAAMRQRLVVLRELQKDIPNKGKPSAFTETLEACLDRCGVTTALLALPEPPCGDFERAAWKALLQVLGRIDAWYERDAEAPTVGRDEWIRLLANAFRYTVVQDHQPETGVQCLSAESVRDKDFDFVFLCGMNEGEFPQPPAIGAIYSESDLEDFATHGVSLDDKRRHASREMLLFHQVVAAARRGLWLTWRLQSRDGREASPSPYLIDTQDLFSGEEITKAANLPVFAPVIDYVSSWRDLRNTAYARGTALRNVFAVEFKPIQIGLDVEMVRQNASPFGPYDGVISSASIREEVARVFGPGHAFSANQLESYAQCPFQFFMERILEIEPEDEPGTEFDPMVRGRILHEVLEAFHKQFTGSPVQDIPAEVADTAMMKHLNHVFGKRGPGSINTPSPMLEVERERMAGLLRRYLVLARANVKDTWHPSHFEVSFGNAHGMSPDPLSRSESYVMSTAAGDVRFSGRIDRIDTLDEAARIIDYKSSISIARRDVDAGVALQLPLYAVVLEEYLMPGTPCQEAWLVQVGRKKTLNALRAQKDAQEGRGEQVRKKVAEYVEGIRAGYFPPTPYNDQCHACQDNRACRYDAGRIDRKREAEP